VTACYGHIVFRHPGCTALRSVVALVRDRVMNGERGSRASSAVLSTAHGMTGLVMRKSGKRPIARPGKEMRLLAYLFTQLGYQRVNPFFAAAIIGND